MPTENRSSNTDPRDVFIRLNPLGLGEEELRKDCTGFEDQRTHSDYLLFLASYRETHPEPQPHPEPIAWMVGTAFWWTKEEAERDAAATGLPIVGLGPITDPGEFERLRSIERSYGLHEALLEQVKGERDRMIARTLELADQLAERDALLREALKALPYGDAYLGIERALSASAEPPSKSGWVDWHGGECPVPDGAEVEYSLLGNPGKVFSAVAARLDWQHDHRPSRKKPNICRYRIKQASASAEPQVKS